MKKLSIILILFFAVQLCFVSCQTSFELIKAHGCNDDTPNWGESLGEVSFKTNQTWIVGNQEWSDVVMASACQKESYIGRQRPCNSDKELCFISDCRSNLGYGDLFSWCAVVRFQNELCPDDWRVPTRKDFIALDKALGGTGKHRRIHHPDDRHIESRYINVWDGSHGGYGSWDVMNDNLNAYKLYNQNSMGLYWSQSSKSKNGAYGLRLWDDLSIHPQYTDHKGDAFMLRCVRNK